MKLPEPNLVVDRGAAASATTCVQLVVGPGHRAAYLTPRLARELAEQLRTAADQVEASSPTEPA